MLTSYLTTALVLAERSGPGRSDDPGQGVDILIIIAIAALFLVMVAGFLAWQRRA
jgi:MYXO-CTERM domain-containing protein